MMTLRVTYRCRPGQAEAFLRAVLDAGLREAVLAEDGCRQYDYALSPEDPDTVVLRERWRDGEAQARHLTQPHMARLREIKDRFVLDTCIRQADG